LGSAAAVDDESGSSDLTKLPMRVFYGSQSGTAQMLAHIFAQEAEQQGIQVRIINRVGQLNAFLEFEKSR
jgi:sulfite reductase alpha subunit-like flavoprotein